MSRLIPVSLSRTIKMSPWPACGSAAPADRSDIPDPVTDDVPVTLERTRPERLRSALPTSESLRAPLSHFG